MERLNTDVSALDSSLQETPEILQFIRVHVSVDICLGMVDDLVRLLIQSVVRLQRVGVKLRTGCDRLANAALKLTLTAGELINAAVLLCEANPLQHQPCGLLSNIQGACDVVRTNPFFAVAEHPHSDKPLVQRNRAVLKNGPDFARELFTAFETRPHQTRFQKRQPFGLATRTLRAIWPFGLGDGFKAGQWVRKVTDCLHQTDVFIELNRFHASSIPLEAVSQVNYRPQ